jgi:beta-galactosidase
MKFRKIKLLLFITCVFYILVVQVKAQANLTDTISLNGVWQFKTDMYKRGMDEKWFMPATNTASWDKMEVPSSWDTHNEYAHFTGDAWYRYSFKIPSNSITKHIQLIFESVYCNSEVWLNGVKIGDNNLGYLAFQFGINKYLKFGAQNTLVLKVNNVAKLGATWNWGGIRRPVWLEITNAVKINNIAITAIPNLQNGSATINVATEIGNYSTKTTSLSYLVSITYKGKKVAESGLKSATNIAFNTVDIQKTSITLNSADVRLWHFEHPELYQAIVSIYQHGKIIHTLKDGFGIRKIEVDGYQLKLNGEAIKTVGFNIVPEDRVYGNAMPLHRFKQMVDLMKESGANMARLSHFSLPKAFLDYLDEKGIMTFEEVSLWGKDTMVNPKQQLPKTWLTKLIKQQYNHPCVIGWSVGNEIGSYKNNPQVYNYIKEAIATAKQLDPNRLASYASNTAAQQPNDPSELCDIIMVNAYGGWAAAAEKVHKNFPSKLLFFSEFGADLNDENLDNASIPIEKMMAAMRDKPYVAGASLWTFNDYRSNYWNIKNAWNTAPSENRAWGIVNSVLQPKQSYYNVKREYQPFTVKNVVVVANNSTATALLNLQSRSIKSFPAYTVSGYQLKIVAKDSNTKALFTNSSTIPTLTPNGTTTALNIQVPIGLNVASIAIEIIDKLGYNRYDTTVFLKKPNIPTIAAIHKNLTGFRVVFNKAVDASKYFVKYGVDNFSKTSDTAILNHYIDVSDLNADSPYKLQLFAVNNAGTTASAVDSITLISTELPPIVWSATPINKGFFISFTTDPLDYKYEVEYGQKTNNYEKRLIVGNRGGINIPNLKSGVRYFFRMRRILQWGFASDWTNEQAIITN